jgi:hypothetical protein
MVIEIESFRYLQKRFFSLHQTMMAGDNESLRINKISVKLTKCQERLIEILKKIYINIYAFIFLFVNIQ